MKSKGQTSIEFVLLTSFMMLAFLVFYIVIQQKLVETTKLRNAEMAKQIQNMIVTEIKMAESVTDGYHRRFYLPQTINGLQYNVSIISGVGNTVEIVTRYSDKEMVYFIDQTYVWDRSTVDKGYNSISKVNGLINITSG